MKAVNAEKDCAGLATYSYPAKNSGAQAETLVLLHGWGCDSTTWQPLLEELQQFGSLLAIDLPGFGASEHQPLTDFESLLEQLQLLLPARAIVIGWSLGGMLAVALAARAPQKISRVITLAANTKFVAADDYLHGMPPVVNHKFNQSFAGDAQTTLKMFNGLLAQGDANERALMKLLRAHQSGAQPNQSWNLALDLLASIDNRQAFAHLSQPGLHILGEADVLVPVAAAESLRLLNPHQRVDILPETAHAVHWSQPQKVLQLIRHFLKPTELDKRKVAKSFSRAATTYDAVAGLQRDVGNVLLQRLPSTLSPELIVDLGCGTGFFSQKLYENFYSKTILGVDIAQGMVQFARRERGDIAHWLCGDAESLPLGNANVDLIFSSLAIQWCDSLPGLFRELRRVLKPGGVLLFSTLGPHTLHELKSAWQQVDGYVHVNRFQSADAVQQALVDGGFDLIDWHSEARRLRYARLVELTRELKALGAHNVNAGQPGGLTGRHKIEALKQAYETFRQGNDLPATYEVYYGVARSRPVPV